ncbi:alpha/beta fold hydrolase [Geodermatophilus sp. SYSU D01036]
MTAPVEDGWLAASDGTRIAYRDHGGTGRGLVLLHGGGANLVSMDQYATRLGTSRRTVAIDVRSCGQSDDPPHFTLTDAAGDVATVVEQLGMGPADVVGHSMGGFVAGFYGTAHPDARIVSIDGFGPGTTTVGSAADRAEFRAFQGRMRAAFFQMTSAPDTGDRAWRDEQVDLLTELYPRMGYTAPNGRTMALRNFVDLGDGRFRRRPPRHLFADAFADDGDLDVLRMYRDVRCPTLIIRCTDSGAPAVLDRELAALSATNHMVEVLSLPLTHLAPAWDALDDVVAEIERFLATSTPGQPPTP